MGKFPIGEINRFIYMDIGHAFQQIINNTYQAKSIDTSSSPLIQFINSNNFRLSDYSTEATINVPNRI